MHRLLFSRTRRVAVSPDRSIEESRAPFIHVAAIRARDRRLNEIYNARAGAQSGDVNFGLSRWRYTPDAFFMRA